MKLTVCLLTYNRKQYAIETLSQLFAHLKTESTDEVNLHIADDGSPDGYLDDLVEYAEGLSAVGAFNGIITKTNSERGGYGKNWNMATQAIHDNCDYVLPLEDDWRLQKNLILEDFARVFEDNPKVGCIRLGYFSFTQPVQCEIISSRNDKFLLLDDKSDEPHIFAGHPRIETVAWEKLVGPWPEGLDPGDTEFYVSTKLARKGIVWPWDWSNSYGSFFAHIGTERSY